MNELPHNLDVERRVYSMKETIALLGIGINTLYKLRDTGQIKTIKLGKRVLIPVAEVERILNGEAA